MKKIVLLIIFLCSFSINYSIVSSDFKVIQSKNTLNKENLLLDINVASRSEMLKSGISKGYVDKIIDYRDITGGFKNLKDMIRISGIGKKTFERLKVHFKEPKNVKIKNIKINDASTKILKYYGFSKKEIKKIEKQRKKNKIRNSIQLKKIISKEKYNEIKDSVSF